MACLVDEIKVRLRLKCTCGSKLDDVCCKLDAVLVRLQRVEELLQYTYHNTKEIVTMSGTLAEQLAAAQADTASKLDAIATDVTEIGADVDSLLSQMQPGNQVTQEMVDAATSISTRVGAVKDGLDAVNAKVPNAPPAPAV